ncbi:MAG: polysaccharide deacetylase [Candidatus Competibacter sp.]|nr:polysaccharide deacetylase [Candidatus Competibacter sp.]
MKTKVFVTIDTEFSIGGAFADPIRNQPAGAQVVLCEIGGKSHGLGFLLDTFAKFGTKATFFVEPLNSYYFGDQPMRDLALRIKAAGHDVQLHLHPVWTYFKNPDWMDRLSSEPPSDHMYGRTLDQLNQWLADGIVIFARWGLGRPVALRTGSLMVDKTVYQAMELAGIPVGSNVGLALYWPDDPLLQFFSGIHRVESVVEACVTTYIDLALGKRVHYKTLTITGSSWQEMRTLLLRAHQSKVESIIILTHPFEYVKNKSLDFTRLLPNRINQHRLSCLCEFLRDHGDWFEVATMGQLASASPVASSANNVILKVPMLHAIGRMVQNSLNDRIAAL